ncbi:hypothetical protein KCP74_06030 [Salmonella enterica subsp. enterica]|nr:hypothetical protein KCP74_06030 [Salmonella enterica subsp. enterica]
MDLDGCGWANGSENAGVGMGVGARMGMARARCVRGWDKGNLPMLKWMVHPGTGYGWNGVGMVVDK